jgi:hypothetical protein
MKTFTSRLSAVIIIAASLFAIPPTAHADTYQIYDLGSGEERDLIGIESSGAVVVYALSGACSVQASGCWETWVNGVIVSESSTNPHPAYDNGSSCTPSTPSGLQHDVALAACNGAHEVYGTATYAPAYKNTIFDGPDPATDIVTSAQLDELRLNSSGDFAYVANITGVSDGEIYEAIDLTTTVVPEPSCLVLLGTGAIAGMGTVRRRFIQQR